MSSTKNTSSCSDVPNQAPVKNLFSMTLRDEESKQSHSFIVEEEVFIKAKKDQKFAQQLLHNYVKALGESELLPESSGPGKPVDDLIDTQILNLSDGNTEITIRVPLDVFQKAQSDLAYASQLFVAHTGQSTSANEHVLYEEDLKENSQDVLENQQQILKNTESYSTLDLVSARTSSLLSTVPSRQVLGQLQASGFGSKQKSLDEDEPLSSDGPGRYNWTKEKTLNLLSSYKKYEKDYLSGILKHSQMFMKIRNDVNVDAAKCATKLDTLKREYRKKINEENGEKWEYFQVCNELFRDKPWLKKKREETICKSSNVDSSTDQENQETAKKKIKINDEDKKIELIERRLAQEDEKIAVKRQYYDEKLQVMKRIADALTENKKE